MLWIVLMVSLVLTSGVTLAAEVRIHTPQPSWSSLPVVTSDNRTYSGFNSGFNPYFDAAYGLSVLNWPKTEWQRANEPDGSSRHAVVGRFFRVGGGISWRSILSGGMNVWLWNADDNKSTTDSDERSSNTVYQQDGAAFSWNVRAMLPIKPGQGPWFGYGRMCLRASATSIDAAREVSGCTPMWQAGLSLGGFGSRAVSLYLEYDRAHFEEVHSYAISAGLRGVF